MKMLKFIFVSLIFVLCSIQNEAIADDIDNYKISIDDEISITVFNEADLSIEKVRVSGNGTISMPLLGQVNIEGLTVEAVEQKMTELFLDGYLKKPKVTVTITEYRPFYINGEVKNPGSYPYVKGLTIEKAVTLAGGFTERASRTAIFIVRESNKEQMKSVALNIGVRPGDVITVNESFF